MTYAASSALQSAVYLQLSSAPEVTSLVGEHIYDAVPPGAIPALYVVLGEERVRDASDGSSLGARHDFTVSVITEAAGFQTAKAAAGAISETLHLADLPLTRGRLIWLGFVRARARRDSVGRRRVDLSFQARVEDN